MKKKIYQSLPFFFQNLIIYLYNRIEYKKRYGGNYNKFRKEKLKNRNFTLVELKEYQKERYQKLITFAIKNSSYYNKLLRDIERVDQLTNIELLPILSKEDLRQNIKDIIVKTNKKLSISKTGGTTGKSLEVKNFNHNIQERFAFLDNFRSIFGYELGKKTAWFSGKNILTHRDVKKNRFWKTDFVHNVRYYSTFHVREEYLKYYLENLIKFKPQFLVGFPSTMLEIASFGLKNNYIFPVNTIKAIFPTAETITLELRESLEFFFKTKLYNQYASSEGAPFIFECVNRNLHLELQSGVFEVLDENYNPDNSGRLVVTSFTNEGTPLIRYDIGDSISLEDANKTCNCGNKNPLVKEILGRVDDFVYSLENGKINLGNVANSSKDVEGILKFQVIQNDLDKIQIKIIKENSLFTTQMEQKFIQNWRNRVGNEMIIEFIFVEDIPVEKSGKFRIVKNNIKHLL